MKAKKAQRTIGSDQKISNIKENVRFRSVWTDPYTAIVRCRLRPTFQSLRSTLTDTENWYSRWPFFSHVKPLHGMPRNVSNTLRIPSISLQTTNSLFSPPHSWSSAVGTTTRRCDRTLRRSRRFFGELTRINWTPWTWWWPWWDKDTQLLLLLALRLNWCRTHR